MSDAGYIALCASLHRQLRYRDNRDYGFVKNALVVPIGLSEIPAVMRHYPILIMDEDTPFPVAFLGLNGKGNSFLDEKLSWKADHYVPLILRLHPFALHQLPEKDAGILLIDPHSSRLTTDPAASQDGRLFDDEGKATDLLDKLVNASALLVEDRKHAARLASSLRDAHLLVTSNFALNPPQGGEHKPTSLMHIRESSYRQLDTPVIEQWFRNGWMDTISLMLASQKAWRQNFTAVADSGSNGG